MLWPSSTNLEYLSHRWNNRSTSKNVIKWKSVGLRRQWNQKSWNTGIWSNEMSWNIRKKLQLKRHRPRYYSRVSSLYGSSVRSYRPLLNSFGLCLKKTKRNMIALIKTGKSSNLDKSGSNYVQELLVMWKDVRISWRNKLSIFNLFSKSMGLKTSLRSCSDNSCSTQISIFKLQTISTTCKRCVTELPRCIDDIFLHSMIESTVCPRFSITKSAIWSPII